jgi:hypothetical protein
MQSASQPDETKKKNLRLAETAPNPVANITELAELIRDEAIELARASSAAESTESPEVTACLRRVREIRALTKKHDKEIISLKNETRRMLSKMRIS